MLVILPGCSTFALGDLKSEGSEASGFFIKGGYAMAGGEIIGAKVNKGFKGSVIIMPDGSITIKSE
jgi:hypothetical protein